MTPFIPGAKLIPADEARSFLAPLLAHHFAPKAVTFILDRELCLDDEYDRRSVLQVPDGAVIPADLVLDFDTALHEGKLFRGVIAEGALRIEGDLLAENSDAGPFLAVLGSLGVRNIIKGGAPVICGGCLTAEGIVFCSPSHHGQLRALGGLKAKGLIVDEQKFVLKPPIDVAATVLTTADCARFLVPDLLVEDEDGDIVPSEDLSEDIIARIKAGEPVLR